VQRAILAGDTETGVTIMQMDSGLDTGPVLLQRGFAISASHTSGSLGDALSTLGASALLEALDGLAAGTLSASPQPLEGVTYAPRIEKAEARIDWSRDALEIERQIRAFNPWPVAETVLDGEPLRILAAQAEPAAGQLENGDKSCDPGVIIGVHDDFMRVRCGRGCLCVTQVQRPGRRRVAVRDYSHSVALTGRRLG
jgi:methionyl-tRNA formyltransferase